MHHFSPSACPLIIVHTRAEGDRTCVLWCAACGQAGSQIPELHIPVQIRFGEQELNVCYGLVGVGVGGVSGVSIRRPLNLYTIGGINYLEQCI
jgi:hypothetical protein